VSGEGLAVKLLKIMKIICSLILEQGKKKAYGQAS
jgi:hypothetical protein